MNKLYIEWLTDHVEAFKEDNHSKTYKEFYHFLSISLLNTNNVLL